MALVLDKKVTEESEVTRTVTMEAKEPKDHDKVVTHKFDVEVEIIERETWDAMNERWGELRAKFERQKKDPDYHMPDEELREFREPLHKIAKPYIRNIGPMTDEAGKALAFDDVKDALFRQTWLDQPIADAFMAVQSGVTVAEYRRRIAKN